MLGATLAELRIEGLLVPPVTGGHVSVKEAVLPFNRFPDVDTALGPEMRSTGEVMGIDRTFGRAFVKSQTAAGTVLPTSGTVFLSFNDGDKPAGIVVAKRLRDLGLGVAATTGTATYLAKFGLPVDRIVGKLSEIEGSSLENAAALVASGEISFVVNTPHGRGSRQDGEAIRKAANANGVSSVTTVEAALAAVNGLWEQRSSEVEVRSLQEYHGRA
jgi:carbamoyl-phosphate synthase large subunit